eukprot:gene9994-11714_t
MFTASFVRSVRPLVKTVGLELRDSFHKRHARFITSKNGSKEPLVKFSVKDGKLYQGEAKSDNELAAGSVTDMYGTVIEGLFQNKTLVGRGKATYEDGTIYEGEMQHDLPYGDGKLTLPDGTVCEGEFRDGEQNGYGTIRQADGAFLEGYFKNNQLHGKGKSYCSGRILRLPGESHLGIELSHAHVTCFERMNYAIGLSPHRVERIYSDGKISVGIAKDGEMEGWTKDTHTNGTIIEGVQVRGEWHGRVRVSTPNNHIEEGGFRHGKPHGHCTCYLPSGKVMHSFFAEGKLLQHDIPLELARAMDATYDNVMQAREDEARGDWWLEDDEGKDKR